jgi:hypothetical protein
MNLRSVLPALLALLAACGSSAREESGALLAESYVDEHRYELPAAQVWAAAQAAVAEDGAAIELRRPSSDGGEIVARRTEGARVQADVTAVDPRATRVVISVTPPNGTLAALIQGRIGDRLSLQKARAELFGERSVETVYSRSLEECAAAADETCRALDLDIVRRMALDGQIRVEARNRDAGTIRFSLRRIGASDAETAVMFTVEQVQPEGLEQLRREFERRLQPAGE